MKLQHLMLTFLFAAMTTFSFAQAEYVGQWKTIDDDTGKAKAYVDVYEQGGKLYGKIVKVLDESKADSVCDKCKGDKKNQKIEGLVIVDGLTKKGDHYAGGTIVDPENGKEYGCSVWFEDGVTDELKVRGKHWTGLYRTQTWHRIK